MPSFNPEVKIVSDGTPWGTVVEINGKQVTSVVAVEWSLDIDNNAQAKLTFNRVALDVTAELTDVEIEELVKVD